MAGWLVCRISPCADLCGVSWIFHVLAYVQQSRDTQRIGQFKLGIVNECESELLCASVCKSYPPMIHRGRVAPNN